MTEPVKKMRLLGYLASKREKEKPKQEAGTQPPSKNRLLGYLVSKRKKKEPNKEAETQEFSFRGVFKKDFQFIRSGFKDGILMGIATMIFGSILFLMLWSPFFAIIGVLVFALGKLINFF